jgi:hypothetical protein
MKAFNLAITISLIFTLTISGCRQIFGDREQPESIVEVPIEASNIIVRSPTHGTIWNPGDTIFIKWIAPTIQRIDILLYRKSEFKFMNTKNIENSGRFDWIVPLDIPLPNHYLIKISSHNIPDIYNFSGRFGIQQ